MKKGMLVFTAAFLLLGVLGFSHAAYAVHVNGYYRSNGTYVNGYERTVPDGNPYNNYSYPGNYNPNTGRITGGSQASYLNSYYGNASASSYDYYPTTPSCPTNSYYDGTSACHCNAGYVVGAGGDCTNATLLCSGKIGLMSEYNSLTKKCECMVGYAYNGSSCVYQSTAPTYVPDYSSAVSSCPLHSHTSATDSTRCQCDAGFQNNASDDGCAAKPIETSDQKQKIIPAATTPPVQSSITPAPIVDFRVAASDIASMHAIGSTKGPATFRKCPSTDCSVIRYYAPESSVTIVGKYKYGPWYAVESITDANSIGEKVTGWIYAPLIALPVVQDEPDHAINTAAPANVAPSVVPAPATPIHSPWYKKIFNWF